MAENERDESEPIGEFAHRFVVLLRVEGGGCWVRAGNLFGMNRRHPQMFDLAICIAGFLAKSLCQNVTERFLVGCPSDFFQWF